jgi:hypothetical protein
MQQIFLKSWRPFAWIAGLAFLLYLPVFWFGFSYLDDNVLILRDFSFLSSGNFIQVFKRGIFQILHTPEAYYRPMFTLSFMLDASLGKTSPLIYHTSNLIFHIIASCLVFLVLKKIGSKRLLAFLAALIFALHPALTSAVAWIPGRVDSLLTIFVLASFIFFLNFFRSSPSAGWGRSPLSFILHLVFFGLAILTKESALLLPIILLIYLYLANSKKLISVKTLLLIIAWTLTIWLFWQLRSKALQTPLPIDLLTLTKTVLNNSSTLLVYIGKIVLPFKLSTYPVLKDSPLVLGWLGLAILAILFILSDKVRKNSLIFGLIWFVLFLLPSFAQAGSSSTFTPLEQRLYLPMVGFLMIVLETNLFKNIIAGKFSNLAWIMVVLAFLSGITLLHSQNFKDRLSFWERAVKTSPSSAFARNNLGAIYYLDGRILEAGAEFQKALNKNSQEPMVHNNLGLVLMAMEKEEQAEQMFKKELELNPDFETAHYNLGLLYSRQEKFDLAVASWEKTLALNPDYLDAYVQLANYYSRQKNQEKAQSYLQEYRKRGGRIQ